MDKFKLVSDYRPSGDQPEAIEGLVNGVKKVNFGVFKRIAIAWVSSPTVAGLFAYGVAVATKGYFGAM